MNLGVTGRYREDQDFTLLMELATEWLRDHEDVTMVHTGMRRGWELAVAKAAWDLQRPFHAHIPFEGQAETWTSRWQFRWASLCDAATYTTVYGADDNARSIMDCNNGVADASDELLLLWDGSVGVTGYILSRARELPVHNLWEMYNERRDSNAD